jgi:hypothetical protein
MNIPTLSIDQAIIHEITDRSLAPPTPPALILSNALSPLDADLRAYFQARIAESLAKAAYPVIADPDRSSPTPDLVCDHLNGRTANLVDTSQAMATHLFSAQQSVNSSPGLLVVATGTLDTGACVAILKLQKQEGLNLERVGDAGAETYSLEHLRRLMLTNDTRVFKVALFDSTDVHDVDDLNGLVSDKQRFSSPEKRMADFFLKTFLGCRLRDDPAQVTSRFYVAAECFINEMVADPEKRARYHRALLAELTSQADTVHPKTFAEQHLDPADRQSFMAHVRSDGVTPAHFPRDTTLIESRLREEEFILDSGIRVRGRPDALDEHADISQDGEMLEMIIRDRLKSVKGAGARRR